MINDDKENSTISSIIVYDGTKVVISKHTDIIQNKY